MSHRAIDYAIFVMLCLSAAIMYFNGWLNRTFPIAKWWRTLFPRTIRQFEQAYCSICDGRIWFWQSATRLYSLGMTRAHVDCAASYIRSKLEEDNRIRLRAAGAMLTEIRQGLKNHLEGDTKHEKHYKN